MKIGKLKLRLSSGKIIKFASAKKRAKFEKYAMALKSGWKPKK